MEVPVIVSRGSEHGPAAEAAVSSVLVKPAGLRYRAERLKNPEVPWITVKLPWGLEGRLLNISSSGLLIESGSKLPPGSVTELKLCGPDAELVVAVRFIRSEVATADHLGVKYRSAGTFEKTLEILTSPAPLRAVPSVSPTSALSHLLTQVAAEFNTASDFSLRTALERGVRHALSAQQIQICNMPVVLGDDTDSICFPIPTGAVSSPILQATFAPGYMPTDLELKLLTAAAGLAAVFLEFDERR